MTREAEIQQRLDKISGNGKWAAGGLGDCVYVGDGDSPPKHVAQRIKYAIDAFFIANAPADLSWCLERITTMQKIINDLMFAGGHYAGLEDHWEDAMERARALLEAQ